MIDDDRVPDPLQAVRLLPRGALVVVRSREDERRRRLAIAIIGVARHRGLIVLIANDAHLASRCGADGLHLSEANARYAAHWRALRPRWFLTAAAHGLHALSSRKFVDALFLSPVFPSRSHAGEVARTPMRANRMAHAIGIPVYALGGVTARRDTTPLRDAVHWSAGSRRPVKKSDASELVEVVEEEIATCATPT